MLDWLKIAVLLSSFASAIAAIAVENRMSRLYGLILMPIAIFIAVNATWTYVWRLKKIQRPGGFEAYDDYRGIAVCTTLLIIGFMAYFLVALAAAVEDGEL
jgi:hypothetical protein